MDKNRLVYKCYGFQIMNIYIEKYNFWAKDVKYLLQSYGFGEVWNHQGVENETVFLKIFKQRCMDIDIQLWSDEMKASRKLDTYATFKREFILEPYLTCIDKVIFKIALCKFRVSAHTLKIESGRRNNIPRAQRICEMCEGVHVEDEFHFLLVCPLYNDLRQKYIPRYYFNPPLVHKFRILISPIIP